MQMDEKRKKQLKLIVVVVCLVLAGLITLTTNMSGVDESVFKAVWVICTNKDCNASYETDRRKLDKQIKKDGDPRGFDIFAFHCSQCRQKTAFWAIKCGKCGDVFLPDFTPDDRYDRCPDCGYSEIENRLGQ